METQYYKVAAYPMKIRLYPTKEQAKTIDSWLLGLQKAYNMTLYALKEGVPEEPEEPGEKKPELRRKSEDGSTEFPNWKYIGSGDWIERLERKNQSLKGIPHDAYYNAVGGMLSVDMKKAWESQGKLPVDKWFQVRDEKGHLIVRWYNKGKTRSSAYLQVEARKIVQQGKSVFITLQKGFSVKARGWNEKIRFSEDLTQSFFDKYQGDKRKVGVRISRDNCGDYYAVISLKDVYRPVKVEAERRSVGVDAGTRVMATDSDGMTYENPRIKKRNEAEKAELDRQLARRFGAKNERFREECKAARKYNKSHQEEIAEKTVEHKEVLPSKRYLKAQLKLSKLERKAARQRDMVQHIHTAQIVAKANLVAIEHLNVEGMKKDSNSASSVEDAAMSGLLQKIKYKAQWSGGNYHSIGTFDPSTQRCAQCGYVLKDEEKLKRGDDTFVCPRCGNVDGRDENAAKSILIVAKERIERGLPSADTIKKPKEKKKKTYPDKPIGKNYPGVFTHFSEEFRQQYKNPFVIVNDKQEVLDDAQGYGYSDRQSAQKFWTHKMKTQQKQ